MKYVKVTKDLMREKFQVFNERFFEGKLAVPTFLYLSGRTGLVGKYRDWGKGPTILINRGYHFFEQDFDDILVHEMIHYYIDAVLKKDPFFSHGILFRKIRRRICEQGLEIHIHYVHICERP